MGLCCDLGQVRDTKHLVVGAEMAELASDHFGHSAADTAVGLIEDKGRNTGRARRGHLKRKSDAGYLATGGDFVDRAKPLISPGADLEAHLIQTMQADRCFCSRIDLNFELTARHAEFVDQGRDVLR